MFGIFEHGINVGLYLTLASCQLHLSLLVPQQHSSTARHPAGLQPRTSAVNFSIWEVAHLVVSKLALPTPSRGRVLRWISVYATLVCCWFLCRRTYGHDGQPVSAVRCAQHAVRRPVAAQVHICWSGVQQSLLLRDDVSALFALGEQLGRQFGVHYVRDGKRALQALCTGHLCVPVCVFGGVSARRWRLCPWRGRRRLAHVLEPLTERDTCAAGGAAQQQW